MYRLTSIERVEPPPGQAAYRWYRYIICSDNGNTITGQRAGTRKEVTQFAHDCARHLNHKYRPPAKGKGGFARTVNLNGLDQLYR